MRLRFPNGLLDAPALTAIATGGLRVGIGTGGYIRIRAGHIGEPLLPVATVADDETTVSLPLALGASYRIRANRVSPELIEDGTIHVETLVELSAVDWIIRLPRIEELTAELDTPSQVHFHATCLDGQLPPEQIELFAANGAIDTGSPAAIVPWTAAGDYSIPLDLAGMTTLAARAVRSDSAGELTVHSLAAADRTPLPPTLLPEAIS
ncbi:MAG: hypothetical protein HN370_05210 [Phycisphaerales bacterium]|jgi:hypothetical protein|nr:hypothetical protein [Phycisphaerales bacterium]